MSSLFSLGGIIEVTAIDLVLIALFVYTVYALFFKKAAEVAEPKEEPLPPPLDKQDMTIEQLRRYNGVEDPHICLAILGQILDVTRGKSFYGVGNSYGVLAGHDATRALGTMNLETVRDEYDDHACMSQDEIQTAQDWADQLSMKYPVVGKLIPPSRNDSDYDTEGSSKHSTPTKMGSQENLASAATINDGPKEGKIIDFE